MFLKISTARRKVVVEQCYDKVHQRGQNYFCLVDNEGRNWRVKRKAEMTNERRSRVAWAVVVNCFICSVVISRDLSVSLDLDIFSVKILSPYFYQSIFIIN